MASSDHSNEDTHEKELSEITCSTAIHVLDSLTTKIKAAEHKLIQQRVDAAVLTVELATLHDPLVREQLALCTQGYTRLTDKVDNNKKILDQFPQQIKTNLLQDVENPSPDSSLPAPLDAPSCSLQGSQT
ncbi:hypothetical protein GWK47_043415 [Chionoecetes opilio]|uniref:Uncharacterized protein n=1 Tax=Chionoecetes opilio TaxID=41210 RepID=A0A8J4Y877_CHIOP|nr:hypothetical protein GWK47_043415 [Chionoecetes opilio]